MKWIASAALIGWLGIVWLAWRLGDARVRECPTYDGGLCAVRAMASRDATLIVLLCVGLVLAVVAAVLWMAARSRLNRLDQGPREANRAGSSTLLR